MFVDHGHLVWASVVMQAAAMSEGQATADALRVDSVAPAPEADMNEEQEEQAADGADDALDSGLEADDDVDLAFIEEVAFLRHVMQPAQVTSGLGMVLCLHMDICLHIG